MDDFTRLLLLALRRRPGTIRELANVGDIPLASARAFAEEAERQGFLDRTDDRLSYRRPEIAAGENSRRALVEHAAALASLAAQNDHIIQALPDLLQAWQQGEPEYTPRTEVRHGRDAAIELWQSHFARNTPREVRLCLPDLAPLRSWRGDGRQAPWIADALRSTRMRTLVSVRDAIDPSFQSVFRSALATQREVRMHPDLPSMFWVSDDDLLGVPLTWGEMWPHSAMTVESDALGPALAQQFDELWDEATDVDSTRSSPEHAWEPMLHLMSQGLTMESAAEILGFTARTGRRRVADAMKHFGASSQFTLGAAWARAGKKHSR